MNGKHLGGRRPNGLILTGIAFLFGGGVSGLVLILLDGLTADANPYLGILTYLVTPVVLLSGLVLLFAGKRLAYRRNKRDPDHSSQRFPLIDLNQRRQFVTLIVVILMPIVIAISSSIGSYRAYRYTGSVTFCGTACHEIMEPQYTAYQDSPHASVTCTQCHVGSGAGSFVKAKLNGIGQVRATLLDSYHTPISIPAHDNEGIRDTCFKCHWVEKKYGCVERARTYFAADATSTPWTIRLLVHVDEGNPANRSMVGAHWHMDSSIKVEYIAADAKAQEIPWVRYTNPNGEVTIFETTDEDLKLAQEAVQTESIRTMGCMDCHNRPAHRFQSPNEALDKAMTEGGIDPDLPDIKYHASQALLAEYETRDEGLQKIGAWIRGKYPDGGPSVETSSQTIKDIYARNFFPDMKARWDTHPDNNGHFITPGCFRCHDGEHVSQSGKKISNDCNQCHSILAQGPGKVLEKINQGGLDFRHPGDDESWKTIRCDFCHTGAVDL